MLDKIIRFISLAFFLGAVWIISREIRLIGPSEMVNVWRQTPVWIIGVMLILTGVDYLVLCGYDVLALRYIGRRLPCGKIMEAAGVGFAVSNTTGHVYAAGGAIRYLFYVPEGITKQEVLKMVIFETMTVFLGMAAAYLMAIGMAPFEQSVRAYQHMDSLYVGAIIILLALGIYYAVCVVPRRCIRVKKFEMKTPGKEMTASQILVGFCDNLLLFLVFYVGLRYHIPAPFFETFMVFVIAQSVGMMTQVPGGLGVFEGTFLYIFPYLPAQKGAILVSLLLFRIMYYFIPFFIGAAYMGYRQWRQKKSIPKSPS